MQIGVLGATGVIGGCVAAEAVDRGHRVTAFTRDKARIPLDQGDVMWKTVDWLDPDSVAEQIRGLDVVISAVNPGRDTADVIANARHFVTGAKVMVKALERYPATRVIMVGGAGSLEIEPGVQVMDRPDFTRNLPAVLGVPVEYQDVVAALREALNVYRLSNRKWTYLSPSAGLIRHGERTGRFRIGGDQLLTAADGRPDISAEDLATALVDEIETPRHIQRRFTVGY